MRAFEWDMTLAWIHHQLRLRARLRDRVEQLFSLADRRTAIFFTLDDQRRGDASMRVRDGGAVDVLARRVIVLAFAMSVVYNVVGLSLALAGALTPLVAAILMPVSSMTVVAISSGAMRWFARKLPA
jgi:hypothetical protein